jgi:hypothetical protein
MKGHEALASATVQIVRGSSRGSGFHFLRDDIIVTNHHVVDSEAGDVLAVTENQDQLQLSELEHSPRTERDFVIYRVQGPVPKGRTVLQPASPSAIPRRGTPVLFAGFPHGIEDLLVQQATVAGPYRDYAFYIDGSVNGGNSGGPIVNTEGSLLGVVTQSRFLGAIDLEQMAAQAQALVTHCQALRQSGGSVQLMGIDFASFAGVMAESNVLLRNALRYNANTGIGIGFGLDAILDTCKKLGLT